MHVNQAPPVEWHLRSLQTLLRHLLYPLEVFLSTVQRNRIRAGFNESGNVDQSESATPRISQSTTPQQSSARCHRLLASR